MTQTTDTRKVYPHFGFGTDEEKDEVFNNQVSEVSGAFKTDSEIIATFEGGQSIFNVRVFHPIDATPFQMCKNIVRAATSYIQKDTFPIISSEWEIKNCSLSHLVKLSSCTYSANDEGLKKKIDSFLEYNGQQGKWYFQPDQRCPVVDSIIEENPLIAKDTLSYSTWLKMWSSSKN